MKFSQLLIPTQKEVPNDCVIISHQLMIRAGLISKLASGLYAWLPLGLMVVRKIEAIIRNEMNKSGAQELLMPVAQPAELWQKTGRWEQYGAELLRFKDRHNRDFCLGPTHEEIITQLASQYLNSYKQLPMQFYQIQTKFRDEMRPRFGVMRSREFTMKDAYSFHIDEDCLQKTYELMYQTYCNIFDALGLEYRAVLADSGTIGGDSSHEFHVLADSGEDAIAFCDGSNYGANVEKVSFLPQDKVYPPNISSTQETRILTKKKTSISDVANYLGVKASTCIKVLIIVTTDSDFKALVLRGDHQLNEVKVQNLFGDWRFATDEQIKLLGLKKGFIGVKNLQDNTNNDENFNLELIVDYSAEALCDFICGANEWDYHLTGVNWGDTQFISADLRNALEGDDSPDGKGKLIIKRGIEVGHIFQLGTKYSTKLKANVIAESGKAQTLTMGCYGIGVTRLVGAIIEQNHDEYGIKFPQSVAPFHLIIVPINYHKSHRVRQATDTLYQQCLALGIEVILDDRKERPGIMFAQSELLGIPHRIVLSEGLLDKQSVEYKARNKNDKILLSPMVALKQIQATCRIKEV